MIKAVFLSLCVVMVLFPVTAQANPYQIRDIRVDVEGETAIDAREKALTQARRNAFSLLTERMGAADRLAGVQTDDSAIASMVDSFEINREKLSKNRYLASVNVTFNQRALDAYIGRQATITAPVVEQVYQSQHSVQGGSVPYDDKVSLYDQNRLSELYQSTRDRALQPVQPTRPSRNYVIQVNVSDLRQWAMIRERLERIGQLKIDSLNAGRAIVTLGYSGEAVNLQNDLNRKGMQLYRNTRGDNAAVPYILMLRG